MENFFVKLNMTSTHHDFVRIHDGVQTMCNGYDCALFELLSNGLLNKAVCSVKSNNRTTYFGNII